MIHLILNRWKTPEDWTPPLPRLDRHVEHIAGGLAFAFIGLHLGLDPIGAALFSTIISTLIEGITALKKWNWKDSAFDWVQYQFHWPFLFVGEWLWFGIVFFILSLTYFWMLLKGW